MPKIISIGKVEFGGEKVRLIAGPCSVESLSQFEQTATKVKAAGAAVLRGGIFKMRTNPSAFQGLGTEGFEIVKKVKEKLELPIVVEVSAPDQIELLCEHADAIQVGSRNMHNFYLLKELSKVRKPIILKRGFCATLKEWMQATEYLLQGGNDQILLCERGIRTFDNELRNTLDLGGVAWVKSRSPFPVIVDPSHGTGRPELIPAMSRAAIACGADAIMVEVHPEPSQALSDGFQSLNFSEFDEMVASIKPVIEAVGRSY